MCGCGNKTVNITDDSTKSTHANLTLLPFNFEWKLYTTLYNDLSKFNEKQAKEHYVTYGRGEQRIYSISSLNTALPNDFDVLAYKNLHKDLQQFTDDQLKIHYIKHGKNENRQYKL